MHHPDDDESLLVTGGQLVVLVVPLDNLDLPRVALEVLVHGEVATALALARVQLQNLQEALVTTACNVTFLLVPPNHVQVSPIGHPDLILVSISPSLTFLDK